MKIIPVLIISILLAFNIYACTSETVCSKLNKPSFNDSKMAVCGCFDLVEIHGWFPGGVIDGRGKKEAIFIRPDSLIEFYRQDTLFEIVRYNIIENETKIQVPGTRFLFTFHGHDSIWCKEPLISDASTLIYVRHK